MNRPWDSAFSQLRDRFLPQTTFRILSDEVAHLLADECASRFSFTNQQSFVLVPVLRSGIAMLPAFLSRFSDARIGMIGLKRDERTARADCYYVNVPELSEKDVVIILDPMIATGGTAAATVTHLLARGACEANLLFVAFLGATPGLQMLHEAYPHMRILVAAEDPQLDQHYFIVPGLGDFGDRYFGTK